MPRDLVSLTAELCACHERVEGAVSILPECDEAVEVCHLLEEQRALMAELSERASNLKVRVAAVRDTMADRFNNILMTVQMVAELLAHPQPPESLEELRKRLLDTIESGRDAVRRVNAGLAELP